MSQNPVITALAEQVICYRRLAKLAEVQHENVRQGQTDALIAVLERRREVLGQIAALEETLTGAKKRWPQYLSEVDTASRALAEKLLAETRTLLEQITAADRDDALVLQQRKFTIGRAITQTTSARQVNRTYASAAYGRKVGSMDLQQ